jgi:Zn-dependent peptidase ImmA (M78 family)
VSQQELFRIAANKALRLRNNAGYSPERPCDVYQLIHDSRLDLQFFAIPTLEGMYLEDSTNRRICVSAFRPRGRQRFTAAHELGHSILQHGTKVDTIKELQDVANDSDPDERLADTFATSLLMSNSAVHAGFLLRNFDPQRPSPEQVYRVATWLGVGYTTLTNHLLYSMKMISAPHRKQLLRIEPKVIKSELVQQSTIKEVFHLDRPWSGERVHAQVGDFFLGAAAVSGRALWQVRDAVFIAKMPGQTIMSLISGGTVKVSVSRENYTGFYSYRYLPEEN